MPVPSGSPRGYPGSPKHPSVGAAEQDILPCLLHVSQEMSERGGGFETSLAFGTHQIKAAAKHGWEREYFTCGLCRHLVPEHGQGPPTKHHAGAQRGEKRARKAIKCGPELPSPSLVSLASWHGNSDSKKNPKKPKPKPKTKKNNTQKQRKFTHLGPRHCLKTLEHPNVPPAKPLPLPPVPTSPHPAAPLPIACCQPEPPQQVLQSS